MLNDLLAKYAVEGLPMPYTMEDYERDVEQRVLAKLTPEKLLAKLPSNENALSEAHVVHNLMELPLTIRRQNHIIDREYRFDALGEV